MSSKLYRALNVLSVLAQAKFLDPTQISYSKRRLRGLFAKSSVPKEEFYQRLMGQRQFTIFGDTNHSDKRIHDFFFSAENAQNILQSGIKHVFLERPYQMQGVFDQLGRGEISEEDFMTATMNMHNLDEKPVITDAMCRTISNTARFCRTMMQNNIPVHCIDDRDHLDQDDLSNILGSMIKLQKHVISKGDPTAIIHGRIVMSFVLEKVLPESSSQNDRAADAKQAEQFLKERVDDTKLAEDIKRVAGDEKSVILYGTGHGSGQNDLDDLLGKDNVIRVHIHAQQELYADRIMSLNRDEPEYDPPNYVHLLDTERVYEVTPLD